MPATSSTVSWTGSSSLWLLKCHITKWGNLLTSFAQTPETLPNITDAPSVVTHINNDLKMNLERPWASKNFSKDVYISSALVLDNSIRSKKESLWSQCSSDDYSHINSEGCFATYHIVDSSISIAILQLFSIIWLTGLLCIFVAMWSVILAQDIFVWSVLPIHAGHCGVVGSTLAFGSIGHGFESEHR